MNYSPLKWCTSCHREAPRNEFRALPGMKRKKLVCEKCYEAFMNAGLKDARDHPVKIGDLPADDLPF